MREPSLKRGFEKKEYQKILFFFIFFKKTLDIFFKVWYNKDTEGKGEGTH